MGTDAKHAYRFDYLKSEKWKGVRLEAIVRDRGECQMCGSDVGHTGDAHHLFYPKSFWDTKKYHLMTLCRRCHDFVHRNMVDIPKNRQQGHSVFRKLKRKFDLKKATDARRAEKKALRPSPKSCWLCRENEADLNRFRSDHPKLFEFYPKVCPSCWVLITESVNGVERPFPIIRQLRAKMVLTKTAASVPVPLAT